MHRFCLRVRVWLAGFLLWLLGHSAGAQSTFSNFKLYSAADGLSSNNVVSLMQDPKGFLWICTTGGVSRFDGSRFRSYFDKADLPGSSVYQAFAANDSILLFATNSGISVFNSNRNAFQNQRITDDSLKAGCNIPAVSIAGIPGNRILISGGHSIYVLNDRLEVLQKKFVYPNVYLVPNFFRNPVFTDRDSTHILMSCNLEDRRTAILSLADLSFTFPDSLFGCLQLQETGYTSWARIVKPSCAFFCNDSDLGFDFVDLENQACNRVPIDVKNSLANYIRSKVLQDVLEDSIFWMGSNDGLIRFNYRNFSVTRFVLNPSSDDFNRISDILFDRDKNLWVATAAGMVKITRLARSVYECAYPPEFTEKPSALHHLFADSAGIIWASSWKNGIFSWSVSGKFRKHYAYTNIPEWHNLFSFDAVGGHLYAGTGRGIDVYDVRTDQFTRARFFPDSLLNYFPSATCLFHDSQGNLWTGLTGGMGVLKHDFKNGTTSLFTKTAATESPDFFPLSTASAIAEDRQGNLWFGARGNSGKLVCLNRHTTRFTTVPLLVDGKSTDQCGILKILCDPDNVLWLATLNDGILSYNLKTGTWNQYDRSSGLPGNEITDMNFDSDRNLWVSSAYGMSVLLRGKSRFRSLTSAAGFPFSNIYAVVFTGTGDAERMIFTSGNRLLWAYRKNLLDEPRDVRIYLEQIRVEGLPAVEHDGNRFRHDQTHFTFEYTGVNLLNGDKSLYAHTLEGWDKDWVYSATQEPVNYSNLSPGAYVFRVKVSPDGNTWSPEAGYSFVIAPPFYQTWWFLLLSVAGVISIVYTLYRIRINRLFELERIRSRISRDLHDDIGSTLSSINILSRSAKKRFDENDAHRLSDSLQKISDRSQRMLDNMNDIIWSVKPENDTLEKILSRMREYASSVLEAKKIPFTIQFQEMQSGLKLSLNVKHTLFLIFKEAVNNLVKYSECTLAEIRFERVADKIVLTIRDNGKGFELNGNQPGFSPGGNGLDNMKQRAAEIHSVLQVVSSPGSGTTVILEAPVRTGF